MPFTDFTIFPDGTVGLCCCDATEQTNLGSVATSTFKEIWESKKYRKLRENLSQGRNNFAFCQGCDFVDAGIRNTFMKNALKTMKEPYHD